MGPICSRQVWLFRASCSRKFVIVLRFRSLGRFSDGRVHVAGWRFFLRVFCQDRSLQDYHFSLHGFKAHTPQNRVLIPDQLPCETSPPDPLACRGRAWTWPFLSPHLSFPSSP